MRGRADIVVCGHICLDVIPTFIGEAPWEKILTPGTLSIMGPAVISGGGAVSNTGLALHRLGASTRLLGKVGDDALGRVLLGLLSSYDPALAEGMLVSAEAPTSYTIVLSPPGVDRLFLHCPGANDTFRAEDVPYAELAGTRIFHFGYPPLMRRMFADGGEELEALFRQARAQGPLTSLDLSQPDPVSEAGQARWEEILARVLPHVDLFLPSLDEVLFMLDRERFLRLRAKGEVAPQAPGELLSELAGRFLEMGARVVLLKLGDQGAYLRTAADPERLAPLAASGADLAAWSGRELLAPCFEVNLVGATGSGDCTVAGFLAGLLHGLGPEEVMTTAVAVGACNVEAADATSGVASWDQVRARVAAGWPRRAVQMALPGWEWSEARGLWRGPRDKGRFKIQNSIFKKRDS